MKRKEINPLNLGIDDHDFRPKATNASPLSPALISYKAM
jgi:hypothetical protein